VSDETGDTTDGSRTREERPAGSTADTDAEYERPRELFRTLDRQGHLRGVVRRSKRVGLAGLVVALFAYNLSPGGISGVILDAWGVVALGFAVLGLLVWLAASAFTDGEFDRSEATTGDGVGLDIETLGAPLLVSLADRTHRSAGARLLWSLLLGAETLPAASAVATESDTVATEDVVRLRRTLERAAKASVVVVAVDLTLRLVTVETALGLLSGEGSTGVGLPSVARLGELLALSPAAWLVVFAGVLVLGGVVGLVLAVSSKT
jgi:hypothetical protein